MKRFLILVIILFLAIYPSIAYAAWDGTSPANAEVPAVSAPKIRANWTALDDGSAPLTGTADSSFQIDSDLANGPGATLSGTSMVFEGTTADADETTIVITDPTEDRTVTVPDATGEVSLLGQTINLSTEITGDLLVYVGTFTRDSSAASGDVAYAGVGFQPSCVFFLATDNASASKMSIGFDNVTEEGCITDYANITAKYWTYSNLSSILIHETGVNNMYGVISTMGADGFTITYTKNGLITGTVSVTYIAFP